MLKIQGGLYRRFAGVWEGRGAVRKPALSSVPRRVGPLKRASREAPGPRQRKDEACRRHLPRGARRHGRLTAGLRHYCRAFLFAGCHIKERKHTGSQSSPSSSEAIKLTRRLKRSWRTRSHGSRNVARAWGSRSFFDRCLIPGCAAMYHDGTSLREHRDGVCL